jgi:hypothetical protein
MDSSLLLHLWRGRTSPLTIPELRKIVEQHISKLRRFCIGALQDTNTNLSNLLNLMNGKKELKTWLEAIIDVYSSSPTITKPEQELIEEIERQLESIQKFEFDEYYGKPELDKLLHTLLEEAKNDKRRTIYRALKREAGNFQVNGSELKDLEQRELFFQLKEKISELEDSQLDKIEQAQEKALAISNNSMTSSQPSRTTSSLGGNRKDELDDEHLLHLKISETQGRVTLPSKETQKHPTNQVNQNYARYQTLLQNVPLQPLAELIYLRQQYAELVGFASYADLVERDTSAASPVTVNSLLHLLNPEIDYALTDEGKALLTLNQHQLVYPWQMSELSKKLLLKYAPSALHSPSFTLISVVRVLLRLCRELGIELKIEGDSEKFADSSKDKPLPPRTGMGIGTNTITRNPIRLTSITNRVNINPTQTKTGRTVSSAPATKKNDPCEKIKFSGYGGFIYLEQVEGMDKFELIPISHRLHQFDADMGQTIATQPVVLILGPPGPIPLEKLKQLFLLFGQSLRYLLISSGIASLLEPEEDTRNLTGYVMLEMLWDSYFPLLEVPTGKDCSAPLPATQIRYLKRARDMLIGIQTKSELLQSKIDQMLHADAEFYEVLQEAILEENSKALKEIFSNLQDGLWETFLVHPATPEFGIQPPKDGALELVIWKELYDPNRAGRYYADLWCQLLANDTFLSGVKIGENGRDYGNIILCQSGMYATDRLITTFLDQKRWPDEQAYLDLRINTLRGYYDREEGDVSEISEMPRARNIVFTPYVPPRPPAQNVSSKYQRTNRK